MLYITTRDKMDSYTSYRVLHSRVAENGGQYLPIRFPVFTKEQLEQLKEKNFNDIVADILNLFFTAHLTGWDIEFAIGKKPLKLTDIGRKVIVAELWRNSEGEFHNTVERLYSRLCDQNYIRQTPDGWVVISIRIAFIFGIYARLARMGIDNVDFTASDKDMNTVIAIWYAKKMGLPIGKIISGTNENCWAWDLIHKGEVNLTSGVKTLTPDLDVIPAGLERLIFGSFGIDETKRYLDALNNKLSYKILPGMQADLSEGWFLSVVGQRRVIDLISSVHRINGYLLDPYAAVSYGALQDFRSRTGENKVTLLLTQTSPVHYSALIADATGLAESDIAKR